ncbi:MAG: tRNA pseudouridine(38-40) synthase TruA, partial [Candidatus Subteraquimicrobiales bacterium]|nr:tRNA pseudouridine(38-40) synthase TruA [Candidatus Subteraquimicrobiales bacterium]
NIKMVIEYDGTNYSGFQRQPNSLTIQGELEKALSVILREKVKVIGAGRTDAGVHALYQVANFKTSSNIELSRLKHSLNSLLPADISIKSMDEVNPSFHSRRSAVLREYKYFILNRSCLSPFFEKYAYFIPFELNLKAMQKAANFLVDTHDFSSFCVRSTRPKNPVRTVFELSCERRDFPVEELIVIKIRANAFLHNMVRAIVGTLVKVGLEEIEPEEVERILEAKDRTLAGQTVPAKGLFLTYVGYEEKVR